MFSGTPYKLVASHIRGSGDAVPGHTFGGALIFVARVVIHTST